MIRSVVSVLGAVVLGATVAGCGDPASDALHDTSGNLPSIHSGRLSLRVSLSVRDGREAGFAVEGPFAQAEGAGLPVADLVSTRLGEGGAPAGHIVSTGREAFSVAGGRATRLPAQATAQLRQSGAGTGLSDIHPDRWLTSPQLAPSTGSAGTKLDHITGRVDVVPLFQDLVALLARGGNSTGSQLAGADADTLRRVVSAATADLDTGHDDRLLRRLDVAVDLGRQSPPAGTALAALDLVHIRLHLAVDAPNSRITVSPPSDAQVAAAGG